MGKVSKALKEWRRKQPRGAIMEPETFEGIKRRAAARKKTKDAEKIAGKAYWKTAKAKFRKYKKIKKALKG